MLGDKLQSLISSCDSIISTCNVFISVFIVITIICTWDHRKTCTDGRLTSCHLVSHLGHDGSSRTNESDARLDTGLSKVTSLGQESISRMDGVHIVFLSNSNDTVYVQVSCNWRKSFADQVSLICFHSELIF